MVGEIGLSPSTRRTKVLGVVSHYYVLVVRVQIYENTLLCEEMHAELTISSGGE